MKGLQSYLSHAHRCFVNILLHYHRGIQSHQLRDLSTVSNVADKSVNDNLRFLHRYFSHKSFVPKSLATSFTTCTIFLHWYEKMFKNNYFSKLKILSFAG